MALLGAFLKLPCHVQHLSKLVSNIKQRRTHEQINQNRPINQLDHYLLRIFEYLKFNLTFASATNM